MNAINAVIANRTLIGRHLTVPVRLPVLVLYLSAGKDDLDDLPPELFDSASRSRLVTALFLPYYRVILHTGLLVPSLETRQVTRIPCLA